jgi:hypothetical protein
MAKTLDPKEKTAVQKCCGSCLHFCNAPAAMEAAFPGLNVMSSGHASVRAQDGLCAKHEVYLSFRDCCKDFIMARDVQSL